MIPPYPATQFITFYSGKVVATLAVAGRPAHALPLSPG